MKVKVAKAVKTVKHLKKLIFYKKMKMKIVIA